MQAALSVFVFGSVLGGMAGDEHVLTVARVIQDAAGAHSCPALRGPP